MSWVFTNAKSIKKKKLLVFAAGNLSSKICESRTFQGRGMYILGTKNRILVRILKGAIPNRVLPRTQYGSGRAVTAAGLPASSVHSDTGFEIQNMTDLMITPSPGLV
ncbi:hypothetical protein ROZALSC1DRAFT_23476, partial [Rozella allomycis CSF55]